MKKIFVAVTQSDGGKYYSFSDTIKTGENLMTLLSRYGEKSNVLLCESRKQADDIVIMWNQTYRDNGKNLY